MLLNGQSAGAVDSFVLSTLPQAPELFSSAAFESGAGRDALLPPIEQAVGSAYAQALNCSISDVGSTNIFVSTPLIKIFAGHLLASQVCRRPQVCLFNLANHKLQLGTIACPSR